MCEFTDRSKSKSNSTLAKIKFMLRVVNEYKSHTKLVDISLKKYQLDCIYSSILFSISKAFNYELDK